MLDQVVDGIQCHECGGDMVVYNATLDSDDQVDILLHCTEGCGMTTITTKAKRI